MALTSEIVISRIKDFLGDDFISSNESFGMLCINVSASRNVDLLEYIFNDPTLQMSFLTDLTGAHYPERKGAEFEVIYHVHSLVNNFRLRIKCLLPLANLEINSAVQLHSGANFMERETYDF